MTQNNFKANRMTETTLVKGRSALNMYSSQWPSSTSIILKIHSFMNNHFDKMKQQESKIYLEASLFWDKPCTIGFFSNSNLSFIMAPLVKPV